MRKGEGTCLARVLGRRGEALEEEDDGLCFCFWHFGGWGLGSALRVLLL